MINKYYGRYALLALEELDMYTLIETKNLDISESRHDELNRLINSPSYHLNGNSYDNRESNLHDKSDNKMPVIAFHGLQGAGKTTWSLMVNAILTSCGFNCSHIGIKDTFKTIANTMLNSFVEMGYKTPTHIKKKIYLSVSTAGEQVIDPNIWSDRYRNMANENSNVILTEDIRTPQNLNALIEIAKTRTIIFIKLNCDEERRRKRIGINFRDNAGYTEQLLEHPSTLPKNFHWLEFDSNKSQDQLLIPLIERIFDLL